MLGTLKKARYRAKYPEKVAIIKKRYREKNREKIAEARKRYNETHRKQVIATQRRYWANHREQCNEKQRQKYKTEKYRAYRRQYYAKKRNREKEKKITEEKLKSLGPLKLTVTLTNYLKSPSADLRIPVVTYFESFCQTLEAEEDSVTTYFESFCQTFDAEGDTDSLTMTNLDSGETSPMDQHVWDKDVDPWLDDLMEDLENTVDVHDLLEDMTPQDWEHVVDDVLDQSDLDLL